MMRRNIFFIKDFFVGRKFAKNISYIKSCFEMRDNSPPMDRVFNVIEYSKKFVPFYKAKNFSNFYDFPVVNKKIIREDIKSFRSEEFSEKNVHVASTSGSTGSPFRVWQDRDKRAKMAAEIIFFGDLAGYSVGDPLYHLKIWTERNRKSKFSLFLANIFPVDIGLFDDRAIGLLLSEIGPKKNVSLIAYSSVYDSISRFLQENPDVRVKGLLRAAIAQSEYISQESRLKFFEFFDIFPVGRYGMEELGVIAQQRANDDHRYYVNKSSHYVEILAIDSDDPVSVGDMGRIVITDLCNKAQPMIRYDTGDLGAFDEALFQEGVIAFKSIDGRVANRVYDTLDRPLSSLIAYRFWWKFEGIKQYQIIQNERAKYLIRLDVSAGFSEEKALRNELLKIFGQNADISFEYSADGYALVSGKKAAIISNYRPS